MQMQYIYHQLFNYLLYVKDITAASESGYNNKAFVACCLHQVGKVLNIKGMVIR